VNREAIGRDTQIETRVEKINLAGKRGEFVEMISQLINKLHSGKEIGE
jgi:hypothetical protein